MPSLSKTQALANPQRFYRFTKPLLPIMTMLAIGLIGYGLYLALFASPADYQQGDAVRIMYVHVPSAYNALIAYGIMAVASFVYLVYKHPLADICAQSAALPGAVFTLICLLSGALWGRPMWGVFWAWDARMTSVLVLFFLYLGYIILGQAFEDPQRARRPAAILAVIGIINLPIIKFSVDWWNSLHQPASLLRLGGASLHGDMLYPLLVMIFGSVLWLGALIILGMYTRLAEQKVRRFGGSS